MCTVMPPSLCFATLAVLSIVVINAAEELIDDLVAEDSSNSFAVIDHHGSHGGNNQQRIGNWRPENRRPPAFQSSPPNSQRNHNLRIVSHKGTYPFESEVRGEGYHSRISFDPFGGVLQPLSTHFGEEYIENWQGAPSKSSKDFKIAPKKSNNPFLVPDRPIPRDDQFRRFRNNGESSYKGISPLPVPPRPALFNSSPWRIDAAIKQTPLPLAKSPFIREGNLNAPTDKEENLPINKRRPTRIPFFPRTQDENRNTFSKINPEPKNKPYHQREQLSPLFEQRNTDNPVLTSSIQKDINVDFGLDDNKQSQPYTSKILDSIDQISPFISGMLSLTPLPIVSVEDNLRTPKSLIGISNVFSDYIEPEFENIYSINNNDTHLSDLSNYRAEIYNETYERNHTISENVNLPLVSEAVESHMLDVVQVDDKSIDDYTNNTDYNYEDLYQEFIDYYYDINDSINESLVNINEDIDHSKSNSSEDGKLKSETKYKPKQIGDLDPKTSTPLDLISSTPIPLTATGVPSTSSSQTPIKLSTTLSSIKLITNQQLNKNEDPSPSTLKFTTIPSTTVILTTSSSTSSTTSTSNDSPTTSSSTTSTSTDSPTTSSSTTSTSTDSPTTSSSTTSTSTDSPTTSSSTTSTSTDSPTTSSSTTSTSTDRSTTSSSITSTSTDSPTTSSSTTSTSTDRSTTSSSTTSTSTDRSTTSSSTTTSTTSRRRKIPTTSPVISTTKKVLKPNKKKEPNRVLPSIRDRTISLSEVLQDIGMTLPSFLVSLKTYDTSLAHFTSLLKQKSIKQSDLKRANGNLGKFLEILNDDKDIKDLDITTPETIDENDKTEIPTWLTQRPMWVSTTPSRETLGIISSTPTAQSSSSPIVHIFGFRPNDAGLKYKNTKFHVSDKPGNSGEDDRNPLPNKLNITTPKLEKGINSTEILSGMFSFSSTNTSKSEELKLSSESAITEKTTQSMTFSTPSSSSLRPYNARSGAEMYPTRRNGKYGGGGGGGGGDGRTRIIRTRFNGTPRTTVYPRYVYSPKPKNYDDDDMNLHNKNSPSNDDKEYTTKGPVKFKDELFDEYFNTTPEISGNVSSKSAIMAGAILGGVALIVFLTILVVVMCRNYMQRIRHRVPMPIPSDASSSSTNPIYSNRMCIAKGPYKTAGFWGTLKKRFDPYSLSSTPTSMK